MNLKILFAAATVCIGQSAARAQTAPYVWPMPQKLWSLPPGGVSTTYPVPQAQWLVRFQKNLDDSRKVAKPIELVFEGDSITDNWQGQGKAVWNERYHNLGSFDFGIGGDRTENVLWRLSQGQLDGVHPRLVVLMIGTNDLFGPTVPEVAAGVKAVVEDYRKRCPEATILLQAIFPRAEKPADAIRAKVKEVNALISKLGDGQKVIYIDIGEKFLQPDGTISKDIMPDFLHPSAAGYRIWADAIQPYIDKYFPPAAAGAASP